MNGRAERVTYIHLCRKCRLGIVRFKGKYAVVIAMGEERCGQTRAQNRRWPSERGVYARLIRNLGRSCGGNPPSLPGTVGPRVFAPTHPEQNTDPQSLLPA